MQISRRLACLTIFLTTATAWSQTYPQPSSNAPADGVEKPASPTAQPNVPENPVFDPNARRAQRLADDLKSPFCPGKTLKTCTSPNAAVVRRDIQEMVLKGMSDEAIVAALRQEYDTDDFSVANPAQPAYTIFVPFVPFVILTGGMILMLWLMRRRKQMNETAEPLLPVDDQEQAASRSALRERLLAEDREF